MKKFTLIVLNLMFLMTLLLQGQSLYHCPKENTVHFFSCCKDEAAPVKSCCSKKKKSVQEEDGLLSLKAKCCSKMNLELFQVCFEKETTILKSDESLDACIFHACINSTFDSEIKINFISGTDPPSINHPKIYIVNCSYLC